MTEQLHVFGIRVIPPDPRDRHRMPEVRPLIDGVDFIERDYMASCGDARSWLAPDGPFAVGEAPHEVEMATRCGCHSALDVAMRREGSTVVWDLKESEGTNPDGGELRFDAGQYDAEVARASTDSRWEWPAQTVARVLGDLLRCRTDWLAHWCCEAGEVWSSPWADEIRLYFVNYETQPDGALRFAGRFGTIRPVTDENPIAQAERLAQEIMAGDPREAAGMRGDSPGEGDVLDWLGGGYQLHGPSSYKWPVAPRGSIDVLAHALCPLYPMIHRR